MKKNYERIFVYGVITAVVLGGTFFAGTYVGKTSNTSDVMVKNTIDPVTNIDFAPFWKTWKILDEKYVAATSTTDQEKLWGAIKGLASSEGDPYTVFFPPEESKTFENDISGNFEGVGFEVGMRNNVLTIIAPLKDSPAEKAGIKPGDKIIMIDGKSTADLTIDAAIKLIRGPKGTPVKLTILRDGVQGLIEKSVVRDIIDIPTIDTEVSAPNGSTSTPEKATGLRKDGVFVIRLYSFTAQSPLLFREALRSFASSGSHKLILDLRGNPGGYLEAAVDMASWFLPPGKVVVTEDFGKNEDNKVYRSKGYDVFDKNFQFIILVDGGSASASEILAGALQEYGKAKLVGMKTFGKGSVQELVKITPDTSLKVTIARWLTPQGRSISQQGIKPDYEVPVTQDDITKKKDPQMQKALELLNKTP